MVEPDGTRRIVEYADDGYGFNAVVKKEGYAKPYAPAPYAPAPYAHAPVYAPAPAPYPYKGGYKGPY